MKTRLFRQAPGREEERASIRLAKQCRNEDVWRLIVSAVDNSLKTGGERAKKLSEIAAFAKSIHHSGSKWSSRNSGRSCSDWYYFEVIALTGSVAELTDERVIKTSGFVESIDRYDRYASWRYFRAIGKTRAVVELTDEGVLVFAKSLGNISASWYFKAIWETLAVAQLTDERVLKSVKFIKSIGSDVAKWYFQAIGRTKMVAELTDERVLKSAEYIKSLDKNALMAYLWRIVSLSEKKPLPQPNWLESG